MSLWLAAIGVGYLATAPYNWDRPQIRYQEKIVYAATGAVTLGLLAASFGPLPGAVARNVFPIGATVPSRSATTCSSTRCSSPVCSDSSDR